MRYLYLAIITLAVLSCDPKPRPIQLNKFRDFELQKIYTHQYNRASDSLYTYLKHDSSIYRAEAAISFASIQDTNALVNLYPLLNDRDEKVRMNAAFAIGQTRHNSSEPVLIEALQKENASLVKRYILEAIGRTATERTLNFLSDFSPQNNLEKTGLAWGIYRAGLKKLYSENATKTMVQFAMDSINFESRLAAGHYFYRFNNAPKELMNRAIFVAHNDSSEELRMAYTRVLRNFDNKKAQDALLHILQSDTVYNVRVDAINALKKHDFQLVKQAVWKSAQSDSVLSVRIAASEFFAQNPSAPDFLILNQVLMLKNWRVQGNMLLSFLKGCVSGKTADSIKVILNGSDNKYQKQLLISGLIDQQKELDFVARYLIDEPDKDVILTTSYAFNRLLNENTLKSDVFDVYLSSWLSSENEFLVRQAAHFICNPHYATSIEESLIDKALENNKRSDKSVLEALNKAKLVLNKQLNLKQWDPEYFIEPKEFRTFNWNEIVSIPKDLKVDVITEKGIFTMQMLVEEAPFTVAHFIYLIKEGFFEGMPFYRVIPNFVNQTGGAKNHRYEKLASVRIKSEVPIQWHRTATVNMASYGKDTESSHFSIMLCPTPWNDNNYTIFAKIVDGMDVVHKIEMGDMIYGMEILANYKL